MIDKKDIIQMAKEARMPYFYGTWEIANLDGLERFAALVAAHKRPWVGLTMLDMAELRQGGFHNITDEHFRAIEAQLKEKNT